MGGWGRRAVHALQGDRASPRLALPSLGPGLLRPPEAACVGAGQARTCVLCLQLWLPAPDPPILGDPAVGTWGLAPPASIQDYLGPCRVEGSVILSGTSHCVCMAVTSRGLAGLLPGPGNLALSLPDERDRVQKKTFTKWVNKHLIKVGGVCAHGCERLCRSACVCVCAGLRGWRRMPWPPGPNKGWSPLCIHAVGPAFCPGTHHPPLNLSFLSASSPGSLISCLFSPPPRLSWSL